MFRPSVDPGSASRRSAAARRLGALVTGLTALLLFGAALTAAESPSTPERTAVARHFEVLDLSDRVLLRPLAQETKLPQIELPDEGEEAIVGGEEVGADELVAGYGAAGEAVAALLRLDGEARRAALGLAPRVAESKVVIHIPPPPIPPVPPRPPGHRSSDARVSFARGITVEADEHADDVICIACSVEVLGEVAGDAVAVGGSSRISGKVYGDVVAVGGGVRLADTAEVYGQTVAVGGTVHRAPGAKVFGKVSEVAVGEAVLRGGSEGGRESRDEDHSWWHGFAELAKRLIGIALLSLLVCLVLLVAPAPSDEAGEHVRSEPWSAGLTGLLAEMLFVPLLVLLVLVLVISIIGIPLLLLVPFLLIALLIAVLVGYAGVAQTVGRWVAARFGRGGYSRYGEALLGIAAIQSLSIFGDLLDFAGGVVGFFGTVVSVLGFAVRFVAWTVGFGAILLVLLAHRRRAANRPALPPPPVPGSGAERFAAAPAPPVEPPPAEGGSDESGEEKTEPGTGG